MLKRVSIPQSEFCPLGPHRPFDLACGAGGFNSSVGILSVGTTAALDAVARQITVSIPQSEFCPLGRLSACDGVVGIAGMFQFLSRNSVRWDPTSWSAKAWSTSVSIPQSEFCPLGPGDSDRYVFELSVSIPQSEFCPLGQGVGRAIKKHKGGFNSSVGILSVGTGGVAGRLARCARVSIPQSEFCPLGRGGRWRRRRGGRSFNSSVGILSVGTEREL